MQVFGYRIDTPNPGRKLKTKSEQIVQVFGELWKVTGVTTYESNMVEQSMVNSQEWEHQMKKNFFF